ncbi:MAG: CBS domain-containing protein [Gammaproteobacteria bacterium]|nr:CBS domain-containing protein [Gammaproteobacteria bacterium]
MKTVHEVLGHKPSDQVHAITPIESVFDAIAQMAERQVGALPVLEDDRLVGIISERDYARKVILKDKSSKQTKVSEIMTQSVVTVSSHNTVDECIQLMKMHHIRHLVVADEGAVTGMLSLRDLFSEIIDEQAETIDQLEHYIRGDQ